MGKAHYSLQTADSTSQFFELSGKTHWLPEYHFVRLPKKTCPRPSMLEKKRKRKGFLERVSELPCEMKQQVEILLKGVSGLPEWSRH